MSGLDKAITAAGGKRRLALALNIKPSSLSRWIHKYQGQVPPKRVIQVYEVTGITPHELRPPVIGIDPASGPDRTVEVRYVADKWIPVSERMPEESGRYWCYVEEQNSLGKSHYQWNCSWNGDVWSDKALTGRVTHWKPLPAAPQEVK